MKTITPEQIAEGMRVRITHTVSKPHGSRVGGTMIHEGVVHGIAYLASDDKPSSVIFKEDLDTDGAAISVVDSEYRTVTIEPGEWPVGTLAYANITIGEDRLVDELLVRKAFRWVSLEKWTSYDDLDIDSGEIILERLRVIHDGRVPA